MTEEKKTYVESTSEAPYVQQEDVESSFFNFQNIYAMLILNWQWFILSLIICVSLAMIYLRYSTPVYQTSAKMLIKDDNSKYSRRNSMLSNMTEMGFMTNSAGIENEVEVLQSKILAREAVMDLKLYTEYRIEGRVRKQLLYKTQPVNVEIDTEILDQLDREMLDSLRSLKLEINKTDKGYEVEGCVLYNGAPRRPFAHHYQTLPATVKTEIGMVRLENNPSYNSRKNDEYTLHVNIVPPMVRASSYVANLSVAPTSKMTSIALLTLNDEIPRRGLEYLKQLAICYNRQANADKNEIALKTEQFINSRLEKIDAELGTTEGALEQYKRSNNLIDVRANSTLALQQTSQYDQKMAEVTSQIELLDYLREFVDNPANKYSIIPSNVGLTDQASVALIAEHNKTVQERNRLLKAVSEKAPQAQTLTMSLDELRSPIRTALMQARQAADIERKGIRVEQSKYQGQVSSTPEQERVLTQIGRQQEVKSGLYLLLLQKREENSISLAATADNGKLIDEPAFNGKVSPKNAIILLVALILGLGLPMVVLFLIQLLSFRIEGHEDLARLTNLPIVADVAVASDNVKSAAGIVVKANTNNQIDEIFRSLRTNIQFMMKEGDQVILFTSSISGEGKTFLAANIAVSFALLGKKVVLCGLDIRKPALGKLFGVKDRKLGITSLLTRVQVTADDVMGQICPSGENENLDLLLAGPTPPNPTELLARDNMSQIIEILKRQYDYVILDTAPVGLVTDTLELSKLTNITCCVVRADYTPKTNIALLNQLTKDGKLYNVCTVLNGVDMSKKKYGYYYGYGRYGKYGKYGSYGRYGNYGSYGNYGNYGNYADSHYGKKEDNSIKK